MVCTHYVTAPSTFISLPSIFFYLAFFVLLELLPPSSRFHYLPEANICLSSRTIFRNLPKSDPQVQQILQHFGINDSTSRKTVPGRTRRRPYQGATAPATSSRNRTRRTRHATRQATAAAAAAAAQIEETSSDAEGESVSEAGPSSGGTLYLPVNPSPNLSPTPGAPDADPYGWCAWEIDYLCVLHIFARLLPAQIAEILNFLFPVNPSGEDVNQKINELCVEEHGVWEYWGAKTNHDSQVEQILTVCGFDCTSVEQSGSEAQD